MSSSIKIAVTGAAGRIAYSLLFRLINGEVFGPGQKVSLQLLEIEDAMPSLEGLTLELLDTASPFVDSIDITSDPARCFNGAQEIFLVGSRPRSKGMKRADLIRINGPIFRKQGRVIAEQAADDVRIVVVGNPANTNCLVAHSNGADVPAERWSALTRLDMNRSCALVAEKAGVSVTEVTNLGVWGNHSATQFPDYTNAFISGRKAVSVINDPEWFTDKFIPRVQNRGSEIINARGASSAASAASAALDHVRDRRKGTSWTSMGIVSDGSYDVPSGIVFSFPVKCSGGADWEVIQGLDLNPFARDQINKNIHELSAEKEEVKELLP